MKKVIVTLMLLTAGLASGATKTDLRDLLVASGDYSEVGPLMVQTSPFGSSVAKYKIVLLIESSTDTLVAYTTQTYLWVTDDEGPSEKAYYNRNNLLDPSVAPSSFHELVEGHMVTQGISGYVVETGVLGNVEWATAVRYIPGSDGSHVAVESAWITRTDGTTWLVKIVD